MFTSRLNIVPKTQGIQNNISNQFKRKEKGQEFPEVSIVGIFTLLAFYGMFTSVYASAAYDGKMGISLYTDGEIAKHGFTLSEAFKYGNRKLTTILCVLFTGLYIGLMIDKGFLSNISTGTEDSHNTFKTGIVVLSFCLLLGFLFLFLVPPPTENNIYQSSIHFVLAIFILLFIIISSVLITYIYNNEYKDNEIIKALSGLTYTILAITILIIAFGIFAMFIKNGVVKQILWRILASGELIIMILYSVIIILFSLMPRLIDYKKICVGVI